LCRFTERWLRDCSQGAMVPSYDTVRAIFELVVALLAEAATLLFRLRPLREHRAAFAVSRRTFPDLPNGHGPEEILMQPTSYLTKGGIRITREIRNHDYQPADTTLARALDERRGVLFSSSFEFPGRYTRWDMGFVDPPLVFTARGRRFAIEALNERGVMLLDPIA